MIDIAAVFFGGGTGAVARWLCTTAGAKAISTAGMERDAIAIVTLAINSVGCLAMGFSYGIFARTSAPNTIRLLVATGFLGGFTTFSTYSLELVNALRSGRMNSAVAVAIAANVFGALLIAFGIAAGDATARIARP